MDDERKVACVNFNKMLSSNLMMDVHSNGYDETSFNMKQTRVRILFPDFKNSLIHNPRAKII